MSQEQQSPEGCAFNGADPQFNTTPHRGREFARHFTKSCAAHPFEQIVWEDRNCVISNDRGEKIFEQLDVEVPSFWSQMAANLVSSKYLFGQLGTPEREGGVRDLIGRVVSAIVSWGSADGYFRTLEDQATFEHELTYVLLHQYAAFNSPVWFNVGVREHPQCSACFIISVDDTIDSLLKLQETEAKLFKYGSGTGTNLSSIRSAKERLAGGGVPSGPVSFMRAFDGWAGTIKSGGKTRRAAKMQILNATHPDIREFIRSKTDEEQKAWALIEAGYDGGFAVPGGAYDSVAFQNANLSVRATDEFMRAARNKRPYWTERVTDGQPCEELQADEILRAIAEGTHLCGDPGMQFDTRINEWHTCPNSGRINASNPCSEYMHLDNSACNLSSINLLKFLRDDATFDVQGFLHTVDLLITAQDILIDNSSYPTEAIGECASSFRQLGLGYANLGALLMSLGLPYDSAPGRDLAAAITALMTGQAYKTSANLADVLEPFAGFAINRDPMLRVVEKHLSAAAQLSENAEGLWLREQAIALWREALEAGRLHGFRNSQTTVLAPTGTISFMMDCDTTGIEPDLSLVKYKKLSDGGLLKIINHSVERALQRLGYRAAEIKEILAYIDLHDTIEGAPQLRPEDLAVFDCAFRPAQGKRSIQYSGHLSMMAAVQPFLSGAISKTVNLPKEITVDQIYQIYLQAWESGIKAVALYRDGSKRTQPLSSSREQTRAIKPVRRRLPDERKAVTHKFSVGGLEGYLTVGLYEDGSPGEIFLVVAKEGSTLSGMMDAFATAISISLQYGVPLGTLVRKFSHMRFEPAGFTGNPEVPMAKSVVDYVFRWLAYKFLPLEEQIALGLRGGAGKEVARGSDDGTKIAALSLPGDPGLILTAFANMEDAPPCTACGSSLMVRQAGCYVCLNCGAQGGCG